MSKSENLSPQELLNITEKEFHESNKLWSEISEAYANAGLKLFDDTITFVYQGLTAMSLVTGFGFAGIQGVQNIFLFFLWEVTMFGAMMFGLYRIKVIYVKNSDSVEEDSKKIREVYEKKAMALGQMMKESEKAEKLIRRLTLKNMKKQIKKY